MLAFSTIAEAVGHPSVAGALRDVYERHYDFIWRSALRLGAPADAAGDVVHDVFLVVARRLPEFEGRSSIKTWLFAIVVRVLQRRRRDLARHLRRVEAVQQAAEAAPKRDAYARSEAAALLHRLLSELDEDKRIVFILSELEGMTAKEIGAAFGVKEATVYSRLRAARERLQRAADQIREEEGGAS